MSDLLNQSASSLLADFAARRVSPVDLLDATLDRLDRVEPTVNAFAHVDREGARAAAEASATRWRDGRPLGPADGLIATIKDNILARGLPTRRGSLTSVASPADVDAPATARLREAGAVILGKTNMPEIGWKGLGDSPFHGATRNPWATGRTSGGSSAGAAVAAALGLGQFHLGTDGLGSIRIPAAFCGVFGFKPSFGRVPAWPLSTMGLLAHLGPLTRHVADAALMLTLIGRPDARDNTAWNTPCPDHTDGLDRGVWGRRIAFSSRLGGAHPVDPAIAESVGRAARVFEELGAHVEEIDPDLGDTRPITDALWWTGAAAAMKSLPPEQECLLDPGLRAEIGKGRALGARDYLDAFLARAAIAHRMAVFHESWDLLVTPQMPIGAVPLGADTPPGGPYRHWQDWSPFTYPFNVTQQPAASVPCGFTPDGLPIALQIVGPVRADALVLRAARAFERARPFATLDIPRQ